MKHNQHWSVKMEFVFHVLSYTEQKFSLSKTNFWHSKTLCKLGWWDHPLLEWGMETIEYGWESEHLGIVLDLKLLFSKTICHQQKFNGGNRHCRHAWGQCQPPSLHVARFCKLSCLHPALIASSSLLYQQGMFMPCL